MIRILYATRVNLCLRRAHTHNILKTVELFGQSRGIEATLVSLGRQSCALEEMMSRHGALSPIRFSRARILWWFLLRNRASFDIFYARDPRLLATMAIARFFLRKKVIFEIHGSREWPFLHWLWILAFRVAHAHIFITQILRDEYRPYGEKPHMIIPCAGVDLMAFEAAAATPLRSTYHLAADAFILLYLGGSQGIYYDAKLLVDMMRYLPEPIILFLVGLKEHEGQKLKQRAETLGVNNRVFCIRRINPPEIPAYLLAADVLLNPKIKGYAGSVSSKLYEYLAAGKPIVASVVPADREVISEHNAVIVKPTAEAFARAIRQLFENPEERERLGKQAREDAKQYIWGERQKKLVEFISYL